jgi:mono/diheme cytochrome c family protein
VNLKISIAEKIRVLLRWASLLAFLALMGSGMSSARLFPSSTSFAQSSDTVDFRRDILRIFQSSCITCHGSVKSEASLRLDSEEAVIAGGNSGKLVVAGNSQESLLMKRLLGEGMAPRMPLGGNALSKTQLDKIRTWIDKGSFAPGNAAVSTGAGGQPAVPGLETISGLRGESSEFVAKIRPILAERCVHCHGQELQQNQLRLDSLAGILKGGTAGKVVIPGNSERSPLVRRIMGLAQPRMPYGAPPLSAGQIRSLRDWIDHGAQGPDLGETISSQGGIKHWAYVKPQRPPLPAVKNSSWCRNAIDYFVLARLEKEGLVPSPEADKANLIRRLSLDLIGLPPTVQEVDDFIADDTPEAYQRVVDRLLSSPHYGERWARPWLDLARYADSHGYEKDDRRVAWKFRDWVIQALNNNMSFREFTIEQIAGDMFPGAGIEQQIATGFHRNTMLNQEGGVDDEEYRWYNLIDRVNTTASVWLGSTIACAQCHNHKYDPFTQKDYYRFLAFFDNSEYYVSDLGQGEGWVVEPEVELPTADQYAKSRDIKAEIAKLQVVLGTSTPELEAGEANWENELKQAEEEWVVLRPTRYSSAGGATLKLLSDGSVLATGKNPEADTYILEAPLERPPITALRLEVLKDPSLPREGPGRDPEGNFFLSQFEAEVSPAGKTEAGDKINFAKAVADESQEGYQANNLVSQKTYKTGWAIDASDTVKRRQLVLIPDKPFGFEQGAHLTVRIKHEMRHASRNIGHFRLSATSTEKPTRVVDLPAALRPVLDMPMPKRSEEQRKALAAAYRSISPLLQPTRERIDELKKSLEELGIVTAMVLKERSSFERPSTDFHIRGSYLNKGERVYAEVPSALNPLPENQLPNRLGLARWLVDDSNPLTARVIVNRYWQTFFGRGLVETSEDFGTQGEPPTHPELLDWLATKFMGQGWNIKEFHRLIVTSATYRQSSAASPALVQHDPHNRLLARGPRFRVEGEMVRDIANATSGLLSPAIGGPSVFPYQPEGIWDRPYSDDRWVMSQGADRYRRAIYTFIRRTAPYPSLVNFDAPSREFCTVRRPRTNTPLQALTTLNDPVFFQAAQAMGRRVVEEADNSATERATYAFRLCVSRRPTPQELDQLLAFYKGELSRFQADSAAACKVTGTKTGAETPELAAWTMVSNLLLSLDETLTKE